MVHSAIARSEKGSRSTASIAGDAASTGVTRLDKRFMERAHVHCMDERYLLVLTQPGMRGKDLMPGTIRAYNSSARSLLRDLLVCIETSARCMVACNREPVRTPSRTAVFHRDLAYGG